MAEMLQEYTTKVRDELGKEYRARVFAEPRADATWTTWLEFIPAGGGIPFRTDPESSQPRREDALYWASGLEPVYLDGAFQRARRLVETPGSRL